MEVLESVKIIIENACKTDIDLKNAIDTKSNKTYEGAYDALENYARIHSIICISDSEALEIFKQYYFDEIEESEIKKAPNPKPKKEPKKETKKEIVKTNKNVGGQMSLFDI